MVGFFFNIKCFILGSIFEYYSSTPMMQYTLLTSAAKSVVAWHMFYTASTYGYVLYSSFFLKNLKESWEENGNITCYQNPAGLKLNLYPVTAILEVQLLRVAFEMFPYRFLALSHDKLAYPMAWSVPLFAICLKIFTFKKKGTLCSLGPVMILCYKLNLDISNTNTFLVDNNIDNMIYSIIVMIEAIIRLCRVCKKKKWKYRNKVDVVNIPRNQASRKAWVEPKITLAEKETTKGHINIDQLKNNENEPAAERVTTKHLKATMIGPFVPMFFFGLFLWIIVNFIVVQYNLSSVYTDCMLLGLPFYWVISSQEIKFHLKLKISQFKVKLGYF